MNPEITVKITFDRQDIVVTEERASELAGVNIPPVPEILESQAMIPRDVPPVPEDAAGLEIGGIVVQSPEFEETFAVPPLPETDSMKEVVLPLPEEGG